MSKPPDNTTATFLQDPHANIHTAIHTRLQSEMLEKENYIHPMKVCTRCGLLGAYDMGTEHVCQICLFKGIYPELYTDPHILYTPKPAP